MSTETPLRPADDIPGSEVWPGELARTALYADPIAVGAALAHWCHGVPHPTLDRDAAPWIAYWLRAVAETIDPG